VTVTSALELARRLRDREVSSEELVRGCLARIAEHDPALHAFVEVTARRAVRAARRHDRALAGGAPGAPPFLGVPIGIKDINFVRGTFTRAGSRAFRWLWSPVDDRITARLRQAGFVVIGKLATSELGAMPVTEPDIHPPTRNPWRLDVTPGGSSGGSAAAVAAGLLPIAQGSDGAGSIRIPSALCGLYGFKPSRGRVVEHIGPVDPRGLATAGPIAHTVDDAAAMLDVLAGVTVGAPHTAPPPPRPFVELAATPPPPLTIRFTTASPLCATDPEVVAAVERVATLLAELGHHVEEAAGFTGELDEFLPLWQRAISIAPVPWPSRLQPVTRWLHQAGRGLPPAAVRAAQDELARRILAWFGDADLVLTPAVPVPAPAIGAWRELAPRDAFARAAELGCFTAPFNITGQPAASIPAGVASWGVPIGVQLAGRALADATVLAVSRQLEAAMPWIGRRPAGFNAR
jgi:amidase